MHDLINFSRRQEADLNKLHIENADGPNVPLRSERRNVSSGVVEAIFVDLEDHLIREINTASVVIGCMAWLTNEAILRALADNDGVSIIVQKEDFLRPDSGKWSMAEQRALYASILGLTTWETECGHYNYCGVSGIDPIRCVGVVNRGQGKVSPRMHHKFLVFCGWKDNPEAPGQKVIAPYSVWTGSFNATHNGVRSLENAVIIHDSGIAEAYAREWRTLLGVSEPLNWCADWVEPDYRIGS